MIRRGGAWLRSITVATVAIVVLSACTPPSGHDYRFRSATTVGKLIPVDARKPVPQFTGTLLDGRGTSLAATLGRVVVINFWASWCPPCRIETPQFDLLYRRVAAHGVAFLGIDSMDTREHASAFVEANRITYPSVFDEPGELALRLGNIPSDLPSTMLLDKRGRVAAFYLGPLTNRDLEPVLDRLRRETR